MSLKEPDRDRGGDESRRESGREKRRRQRAAAKRQKALAAAERKRRSEQTQAQAAKPEKAGAKKPADAEKPASRKPRRAERKAAAAKKPEAPRPEAKKPEARKPEAGTPKAKRRWARRPGSSKLPSRRPGSAPRSGSGPKPGSKRSRGGASKAGDAIRKVGGGILGIVLEVAKLAREMLVIPLQLWLGLAEIIGGFVLAVWLRAVLPVLKFGWRALGALLRFAERNVTPARALTVVSLVAIGALIAAQWRDYSAVSVGTDAYAGDVGSVAPPPEVSSAPAHDAHGWVMVILGGLALLVLAGALTKRRRLGNWLIVIGVAVLVISIAVDAPKGLDEGQAAIAYESATASLLSGFWLQIAAGSVLIACGAMLPRALRPVRTRTSAAELGPSLIDQLVARGRRALERRRARPKPKRRLPARLRRPAAKGKVQRAGT